MRVLIIKMSSMGDVIHALPAVNDAVKALPEVRFDWVVEESFSEIPLWNPVISKVIPINLRKWRKKLTKSYMHRELKQFLRYLREAEYDLIIDAQGLLKSALVGLSAKGNVVGYDRQSIREPIASLFYKKKITCDYQQHAIDRIRILFSKALGYPCPNLDDIQYGLIDRLKTNSELNQRKYFMFLHGTSAEQKLWPIEHWIMLGRLLQQLGYHIVMPWGNHEEFVRAQHIAKHLNTPLIEVLPKKTLTELKELIFYASGIVSVDTGLAHLAAALDKHNFVLYADTDPKLIGTRGLRQHHFVMKQITPIKLYEQIITVLQEPRSYLNLSESMSKLSSEAPLTFVD